MNLTLLENYEFGENDLTYWQVPLFDFSLLFLSSLVIV